MANDKQPMFRTVIGMMISPGSAVKGAMSGIPWVFSANCFSAGLWYVFSSNGT